MISKRQKFTGNKQSQLLCVLKQAIVVGEEECSRRPKESDDEAAGG